MRLLLVARLTETADLQIEIAAEDYEARAWAEHRGHQIIAVAADHEWREKCMWKRPNLRSWVTDPAKITEYDGIVAANQDRLSRARWGDETEIRWWLEDQGKELFIVSPELHWPPRSLAEQVIWELEAARSRAERETISNLYRRTRPYLSGRGYLVGRPPFGYKVIISGKHETLELIAAEAAAIRGCVARYLHGASLRELCEQLDQMGLAPRGGGTWHSDSLSHLFRNQILAGRVTDAQGRTELKVPSVLPPKMWQGLQANLDLGHEPLLTGILHCARCTRAMSRLMTRQGEFYYCRSGKGGCNNLIGLEIADRIVSDSLLSLGHVEYLERRVVSGGDQHNEVAMARQEIRELKLESPKLERQLTTRHAGYAELNAPRQTVRVVLVPAGRTIAQVWKALDTIGRRRLLLELGYGGESVFQRGKPRVTGERSPDGTVRVGIEPPELLTTIAKLSERGGKPSTGLT